MRPILDADAMTELTNLACIVIGARGSAKRVVDALVADGYVLPHERCECCGHLTNGLDRVKKQILNPCGSIVTLLSEAERIVQERYDAAHPLPQHKQEAKA